MALLDFIVVYDSDREPRILARNEVHVVPEYFATSGG
jgi:hypothetical protein